MTNYKINAYTFLIIGIVSLLLGIFSLVQGGTALQLLIVIIGVYFALQGLIQFVMALFHNKQDKKITDHFMKAILNIGFGILMIFANNIVMISISLLFGIYLLIVTITHAINFFIYRHYHIRGKLLIIVKFIINLLFSILLLTHPKANISYLSLIMGIYLLLYGITGITDFLTEIIPQKTKNKIKKNISIQLPILVAAFIPRKLITYINQLLAVDNNTEKFDYRKKNQKPDLFVIIHLAKKGTAAMGHVEVAYEGKIYSYGNYDMHSRSLWGGLGDGVVLIADQQKYIEYCVTRKERYLVEFGIVLSTHEKEVVRNRIDSLIHTNTIDYYPDQALADQGKLEQREYHDMSSEIYHYADGKFKKIIAGKHKKIFVLMTNCAIVVQYILSSVGKEILAINGILSPGAYYDYLNNRFMMKNTNVISRKVYTKNNFRR